MKILLFTIASFTILVACSTPSKDYEAIATELCACMTPMVELNARIEKAIAQKDSLDMKAILSEAEEMERKSIACTDALEDKLGESSEADLQKANVALKKVCPEVAEILEEAGF